MNLFRLLGMLSRLILQFLSLMYFIGDLSHLASIFILLHKIQTTRSCRGMR